HCSPRFSASLRKTTLPQPHPRDSTRCATPASRKSPSSPSAASPCKMRASASTPGPPESPPSAYSRNTPSPKSCATCAPFDFEPTTESRRDGTHRLPLPILLALRHGLTHRNRTDGVSVNPPKGTSPHLSNSSR